jgi:hypothetical protein
LLLSCKRKETLRFYFEIENFTLHELKVTQFDNLEMEKEKKKSALKPLENWAKWSLVDGSTRGAMSP